MFKKNIPGFDDSKLEAQCSTLKRHPQLRFGRHQHRRLTRSARAGSSSKSIPVQDLPKNGPAIHHELEQYWYLEQFLNHLTKDSRTTAGMDDSSALRYACIFIAFSLQPRHFDVNGMDRMCVKSQPPLDVLLSSMPPL